MAAKANTHECDASIRREAEGPTSNESLKTAPYGNTEEQKRHHATGFASVRKPLQFDAHREPHRIAAIIASGVALLTSIGSVITAGVMWQQAYSYTGTDTDRVLYAALYIFVLVESCLSFIATLVYFSVLFYRPREIMIHDGDASKFVGRCITVFLLLLMAAYSFVVPIVLKDHQPKTSPALCVIPGVRFFAVIAFFGILLADSRN